MILIKKTLFPNRESIYIELMSDKKIMEYSKPAILYFFISAGNEMVGKSFNLLWSVRPCLQAGRVTLVIGLP